MFKERREAYRRRYDSNLDKQFSNVDRVSAIWGDK